MLRSRWIVCLWLLAATGNASHELSADDVVLCLREKPPVRVTIVGILAKPLSRSVRKFKVTYALADKSTGRVIEKKIRFRSDDPPVFLRELHRAGATESERSEVLFAALGVRVNMKVMARIQNESRHVWQVKAIFEGDYLELSREIAGRARRTVYIHCNRVLPQIRTQRLGRWVAFGGSIVDELGRITAGKSRVGRIAGAYYREGRGKWYEVNSLSPEDGSSILVLFDRSAT